MIVLNATLKGEKTYDITTGNNAVYRVSAYDIDRALDIVADYIGAQIPDAFVVGYGLDYDEKYRNLPFVGVLKREVYEK